MELAKLISSFFRRTRVEDAAFVQLWIVDLGPHADDVIAYIAEEQEVECSGLHAAYGLEPSLYLEFENADDTLFWVNRSADALEERGAKIDIKFANQSLAGLQK